MRYNRRSRAERGVTMIEVLITILITAIGLLGLASLQLVNLKNINNSQYRTQATILAYSMAERMRSNQAGVAAGAYDDIKGDESQPACTTCAPALMAQMDAYEWNQMISAGAEDGGLPAGAKGTVKARAGGENLFDITILWEEQERGVTGGSVEEKSLTLSTRINL